MPVFLILPILGWSWPSLVPLVVAAASGYGYRKLSGREADSWLRGQLTRKLENMRRVSVPVDELVGDVVGEEVGRDERLVFERNDYRLVFRRDARGKFLVDVVGPREVPAATLRKEALAFTRDLVQEFVYNRVVTEMEARGLNVVGEEVETESGDIVLNARRWR